MRNESNSFGYLFLIHANHKQSQALFLGNDTIYVSNQEIKTASSYYMKCLLFSLELGRVILVYLKIYSFPVESCFFLSSVPPRPSPPHPQFTQGYLVTSHIPGSFLTYLIIWHLMNSIHSQPTKKSNLA